MALECLEVSSQLPAEKQVEQGTLSFFLTKTKISGQYRVRGLVFFSPFNRYVQATYLDRYLESELIIHHTL